MVFWLSIVQTDKSNSIIRDFLSIALMPGVFGSNSEGVHGWCAKVQKNISGLSRVSEGLMGMLQEKDFKPQKSLS